MIFSQMDASVAGSSKSDLYCCRSATDAKNCNMDKSFIPAVVLNTLSNVSLLFVLIFLAMSQITAQYFEWNAERKAERLHFGSGDEWIQLEESIDQIT